ncbi:MAG: B-box zinc finger protein [Anaerolineales bacterium]
MSQNTAITCANHPNVETTLRCNRCEKPICAKCAVRMPTGYRCRECVKAALKIFDTAEWYDYPLGFLAAAFLSLIASGLLNLLGFISYIGVIFVFVAAPTAGLIISEGVRMAIRRHRSGALYTTVFVGLVLGALPIVLANLIVFNLFGLIIQGIYLVMVVPTVYSRLSGLQLFK